MQIRFLSLTKNELLRLLASFLLGLLLGALLLNLVAAQQIDELIYQNNELNKKIVNQKIELQQLEENLANRQWRVVQRIKISIEGTDSRHITQELESKLHQLLENIIGRQISNIDGTLIANTIDERIIAVEEHNYQISLIWLLLQEETVIKVEATRDD